MGSFYWGKEVLTKLHFVWKALKKFDDDHGFFLSSGITFNPLICLVSLILLLLSLAGIYLYGDREVLDHIRRYFENAVPTLDPKVMKNIFRIIRDRKIVGILGVGGLIWTSTWVFGSLRIALNIVFSGGQGKRSSSRKGNRSLDDISGNSFVTDEHECDLSHYLHPEVSFESFY